MINTEDKLIGTVSDEQIQTWKSMHGKIYAIEVDDSICYLKRPDRKTLSAAAAIGQSDPIKFAEIMLDNCWLGGDPEIKTDDVKFLGASSKLDSLVQVAAANLKEL
ncbi:MAG: hypothetical protein ACOX4D_07615 [Bacteroidales bacterium]|jgi:hypothetical protein